MKLPTPRKLPSGSWSVRLRLGGEDISITAATKTECLKQAQQIKLEYKAGVREKRLSGGKSLGEAIDEYITLKASVLSPSTIRGYKEIRRNRFQEYMALDVSAFDRRQCSDMIAAETRMVSPKTIKSAWSLVAASLSNEGVEPPRITLPKIPAPQTAFIAPEDLGRFIDATKGDAAEIPILLGLMGLRRSEIFALDWEQINLQRKTVSIRGALVLDDSGEYVRKHTNKNAKSTRTVRISIPQLLEALEAVPDKSGPVCTCHPNTLHRNTNKICERLGIPKAGAHGLRRSFVALQVSLGIPEAVTMADGGWTDRTTMHRHYEKISQGTRNKYSDLMENFLKNAAAQK